jgi:hypothetical protein
VQPAWSGGSQRPFTLVLSMLWHKVWERFRISPELVEEVGEWLSEAEALLSYFARSTYAVVKINVVESWPRVTLKRSRRIYMLWRRARLISPRLGT